MIEYQAVIATRNDLGQLASMQNKFVRLALERLRLSIKEFVNELPAEMDQAYAAAVSTEATNSPRVFVPTRPSLLRAGESLRIFIIAPGIIAPALDGIAEVNLLTRRQNTKGWQTQRAAHAGRSVYTAQLGPFQKDDSAIEYYATAAHNSQLFWRSATSAVECVHAERAGVTPALPDARQGWLRARRRRTRIEADVQLGQATQAGTDRHAPEGVISPELTLNPKPAVVFTSAANAVLLPKAKPGAMGEQFVMSSIRGREVARAQWSMVWLREDSFQALDFGNGLLGVHPPQYPT